MCEDFLVLFHDYLLGFCRTLRRGTRHMRQPFLHFGMKSLKAYVRKTSSAIGAMETVFTENEKKNRFVCIFFFNIYRLFLWYYIYRYLLSSFIIYFTIKLFPGRWTCSLFLATQGASNWSNGLCFYYVVRCIRLS